MWKACASRLFGRDQRIRAHPILVFNRDCATFIRTKKDSLYKTVCVNIVLVYRLRWFLYSFPRFRRRHAHLSCVPIYALGRACLYDPLRRVPIYRCRSCIYAPDPCRSIYVRLVWRRYRFHSLRGNVPCAPGLFVSAVIPPIGNAALFYVIRPPGGAAITVAPIAGALKGGQKQ